MEEEKTTGLSKEKIQALKKMKMGKSKQVCPICLANFEPGEKISLLSSLINDSRFLQGRSFANYLASIFSTRNVSINGS